MHDHRPEANSDGGDEGDNGDSGKDSYKHQTGKTEFPQRQLTSR